ncbi:amino acid transporter [Fomes fomentarius]|nr:amino acid transporter [Fomes fomentarius]
MPDRRDLEKVYAKDEGPSEKTAQGDVFGDEAEHDIQYKTLSWQLASAIMIAEIISNGMLTLPNAMAVVGIVPSLVLTIFLGVFALYTALLLIDFKLNHPEVHNMGDAGFLLFGPVGREILSAGSVIFAIFSLGALILSGQQALSVLSDNGLCSMVLLAIFATVTFLLSLPRTLNRLSWLGFTSVVFITLCGFLAMVGAGANPVRDRVIVASVRTTFDQAFLAITGPVFAYCGHFIFFILISEMRNPEDAKKASAEIFNDLTSVHRVLQAAWVLQGFATTFYAVFSVVLYSYVGSTVASPALFSLPPVWSKITFAIGMVNFLITGALYAHASAKLIFVRLFRHTHHVYSHTWLGWGTWVFLCFVSTAVAFVFATAVPIFSYLTGITASLFASWYTYGIAGFFWLHDTFYLEGGREALARRWVGTTIAVLTILAGAFMCVAGTYVSIKLIVDAYHQGIVGKPFTC